MKDDTLKVFGPVILADDDFDDETPGGGGIPVHTMGSDNETGTPD
jgi:hypothetical protein